MEGLQTVVALVVGTVMALFVPALVWATVIAGLYQMVRDKIREIRSTRQRTKSEPVTVSIRTS